MLIKTINKYLNLGCGSRFHPEWTNIDFQKTGKDVIQYDLIKGIPVKSNSFDVVYHSHVLEHFPQDKAEAFIKECYRVLKPGGIIRVVVPDLEIIVRNYLKNLDSAKHGGNDFEYRWDCMELLDQISRNKTGGQIVPYIKNASNEERKYIIKRWGNEALGILNPPGNYGLKLWQKLIQKDGMKKIHEKLTEVIIRILGGRKLNKAFKTGLFRLSGEPHLWMYDSLSLASNLKNAGFIDIKSCKANESRINNFNDFGLDIMDNLIRKPDSLFMEAKKPL